MQTTEKGEKKVVAGILFNYGIVCALVCLCIALVGFAMGGRVA